MRQVMSKNFSIPMSEANPGSVTTVVPELEGDPVGDERVVAVCNVHEGSALVDEGGLAFERLDEVQLDRFPEHDRERACCTARLLRGLARPRTSGRP